MPFTISQATDRDIPALAQLHVEGWRAAYDGLVGADYLKALSLDEKEKEWKRWMGDGTSITLLARDEEGRAAGFVSFGRLRTPPPGLSPIRPLYSGEIYAIYSLPATWRQGLGRQLMRDGALGLQGQKHKSLCLWVMQGNKRAVAFYKALGGQRCGTKEVEVGGRMLSEIAFGWRDTKSLTEFAS